jgi:glycosyltransferase involved in cell wall biosynthesis
MIKISVLTPSYNSGKYIERAIKSVIEQKYENFEHIIVDGGSNDNTLEIIKKYPNLNWISEKDKGQSDAMNKAFKMAKGDVVVYLNADDYFLPHAFDKVTSAFEKNKNAMAIVANLHFNLKGNVSLREPTIYFKDILKYWTYSFPLNPVSYFYKREIQDKIGPFPVQNHYSMDFWFLLRMYYRYPIIKINETLGEFYLNEDSKSNNIRNMNYLKNDAFGFLMEEKKYIMALELFIHSQLFNLKRKIKKLI